jgi:uncharacterized damage-inducible protein DinB
MSQVPIWFERSFDFTFPVELYPNVCVRLQGTPARLEELLAGVSPDVSMSKSKDQWSAQEHAGHLLDMETLWAARLDDFLGNRDTLTVADLSNRKTYEANHNARRLTSLLSEFRETRLRLVDRLTGLQASIFARSRLHPRLRQPMRLVDHLYFVAEHDDHDLARICELINT